MSSLPSLFTDNILPIIIVAAVGFILERSLDLNVQTFSRIVFYAFTPALVFTMLINTEIQGDDVLRMVGLTFSVILLVGVSAWFAGKALKLRGTSIAALVLGATFMNSGNVGLPLSLFALGAAGLAWGSIYFLTNAVLMNSAGVYIATAGRLSSLDALKGLAQVPSIYAIPLALLVRAGNLTLPPALLRPIDLLSSASVPAMLLMMGMQISHSGLPRRKDLLLIAVFLRLIFSPLLAFLLSPRWGLTGVSQQAAILQSAMPTAILTTVLATEFDVDPEFVTGTVLVSTLLSPITVTPLLALIGG